MDNLFNAIELYTDKIDINNQKKEALREIETFLNDNKK